MNGCLPELPGKLDLCKILNKCPVYNSSKRFFSQADNLIAWTTLCKVLSSGATYSCLFKPAKFNEKTWLTLRWYSGGGTDTNIEPTISA